MVILFSNSIVHGRSSRRLLDLPSTTDGSLCIPDTYSSNKDCQVPSKKEAPPKHCVRLAWFHANLKNLVTPAGQCGSLQREDNYIHLPPPLWPPSAITLGRRTSKPMLAIQRSQHAQRPADKDHMDCFHQPQDVSHCWTLVS